MTQVVAALIWDENKFMICQRPVHKTRGLLWEFVGGKVEKGESKPQALIRECREELDVTVSVGDVFIEVIHEYPDITVDLTLFNCEIADGGRNCLSTTISDGSRPMKLTALIFALRIGRSLKRSKKSAGFVRRVRIRR